MQYDELHQQCPDLTEAQIREMVDRLDERYFETHTCEEITEDGRRLAGLTSLGDHDVSIAPESDDRMSCTIYAHDFPGVFSLIVGLLSASGLNIEHGTIYTYSRKTEERTRTTYRGHRRRRVSHRKELPRKIVDTFTGRLPPNTGIHEWRQRCMSGLNALFDCAPDTPDGDPSPARQRVYEMVAQALSRNPIASDSVLYPVRTTFDNSRSNVTRLTVVAEDTPFFLFSLSNALSLCGVLIESVRIGTRGNRVEDEIEVVDRNHRPITDAARLDQIRLSVLLTKQFTYFLGSASDPHSALVRFEAITRDLLSTSAHESWNTLLSNPDVLRGLSRILGASDFLWEDFFRIQYESILPALDRSTRTTFMSRDRDALESALEEAVRNADEPSRALNDFKNHEIYLIDLDHIIHPEADLQFLGRRLTALAEAVVQKAVDIAGDILRSRYGSPKTFAGLEARYAVMGLGKLGGEALGYASDIELMFVYADSGSTDGHEKISNSEYFERCFKTAVGMIEAKEEGIFHIDLRLRPYGSGGHIACSLATFCKYYAADGPAHSYERLALVRMRAIGGDPDLGRRIQRLRDEMVYATDSIDPAQIRQLREKQFREKTTPGKLNAKFSPGGLVDLEYTVQILQCRYGKTNPALRTPRIHEALAQLENAGLVSGTEVRDLVDSYYFLRRLINGLRMLRGSAVDLFLPEIDSDEYVHLARRTGYSGTEGLSPAHQLHLELETRTALIRRFIESHIGRDSIPGPPVGNAADLVLSDDLPAELRTRIFKDGGFAEPERAYRNIVALRGGGRTREKFARLAVLAWDVLQNTPDPDMALNNWERFARSLPDAESHFDELLAEPLRIEVLLGVFSASQFLADTLIHDPDFLPWVARPKLLHAVRSREQIAREAESMSHDAVTEADWFRSLRRLRRREILRIGLRDVSLGVPLQDIVVELSNLAEAIIDAVLRRIWRETFGGGAPEDHGFCVLAFGKLGGRELNYSSDVDILAVYDHDVSRCDIGENIDSRYARVVDRLRAALSDYTEDGFVYRVDFRLRPHGRAGLLVPSSAAVLEYYAKSASAWELQAAVKLRPVAGSRPAGDRLRARLLPLIPTDKPRQQVFQEIADHRDRAVRAHTRATRGMDIKSCPGGIREIEFLVQGLQLIHGAESHDLLTPNTLTAVERLRDAGRLDPDTARTLTADYLYLRRVEHFLQLFEDRQVHVVPTDPQQLDASARRIHGTNATARTLLDTLQETTARVTKIRDGIASESSG